MMAYLIDFKECMDIDISVKVFLSISSGLEIKVLGGDSARLDGAARRREGERANVYP